MNKNKISDIKHTNNIDTIKNATPQVNNSIGLMITHHLFAYKMNKIVYDYLRLALPRATAYSPAPNLRASFLKLES
jgi:hypothetical protein